MRTKIPWASAVFAAAAAAPALACPVCQSGRGAQVRAGLVDGNLGPSVLAVVLPFVVLSGVTAAIHFGLPGSKRKK